jgi:xylulose-5-phosphate/fructose-6-phosphate phosphoketolase
MDHCLASRHYVNVIVAGKHAAPQWLTIEEAREHCSAGIGIWKWASNDIGCEPDFIMASAGDVPTLEALAAVSILRKHMPKLKIRFVNVVDLMELMVPADHPHGLTESTFDSIFTKDKPVLFNFHAYPQLVERLIFDRKNRDFLVRGYIEQGTISTPFDMTVMNGVDRFHLVMDACDIVENKCKNVDESARWAAPYLRQEMQGLLVKHNNYIEEFGVDMDIVENWRWDL